MKRLICIILVLMCTFCMFARDRHVTSSPDARKAEDLLEQGLYKNQQELYAIAPVLTPDEIDLLYKKNKQSSVKDSLENGLLGLGIGSFVAGDKKGGLIQLGVEGGGAILTVTSFGYFIAYGFTGVVSAVFGQQDKKASSIVGAASLGIFAGIGCMVGGRIYGVVRGIKYPKQYNQDLHTTLYGAAESAPQITFAPAFTNTGVGFGVGVKF